MLEHNILKENILVKDEPDTDVCHFEFFTTPKLLQQHFRDYKEHKCSVPRHLMWCNVLQTASANIRPQSVARVPSPQELIAHTQAIMQSALIKKQLEDQKERFLKKQQERYVQLNNSRARNQTLAKQKDLQAYISQIFHFHVFKIQTSNEMKLKTCLIFYTV